MKSPFTVVMLGDSLTKGFALAEDQVLPVAIERELMRHGLPVRIVNAGISGNTTGQGLARYDRDVVRVGADLLVVALGANDFVQYLPAATARANLATILTRARQARLPTVLVGMAIPGAEDQMHAPVYAAMYEDVAREFSVPLLPDMFMSFTGRPQFLFPDGVHPTAEGVEAMARDIADFLTPVVRRLAAG